MKLDQDIYSRCLATAKGYYRDIRRKKEIEREIIKASKKPPDGLPKGSMRGDETARKAERIIAKQSEIERRIAAVERAWLDCGNRQEQEFIKKNLFEGVQMWQIYILLPDTGAAMSERTMKRYRKKFLCRLADYLHEI